MLRAEKTDEHKLPHFIDNQPRSTAARGMTTWSWGALGSRIFVMVAERQHYLHARPLCELEGNGPIDSRAKVMMSDKKCGPVYLKSETIIDTHA